MNTDKVDTLFSEIRLELNQSTMRYGEFNSAHEGYAVIKEELDELWDIIKSRGTGEEMREEVIQIAAMSIRFLLDFCEEEPQECIYGE